MSGKAKRRREARRRARQRSAEQRAERPPQEEDATDAAGSPEEEPSRRGGERLHAAASEAGHGRAGRKRAKGRGGRGGRAGGVRISPWLKATPVVAIGVGVLAFLIISSVSSGTGGVAAPSPTPDPRVAGLTPDVSFDIDAGGEVNNAFFSPNAITADAGDVVELVVTNIGSVSHNLRVAGLDDEYDTADDFEMPPNVILPGETQRLVVKLDQPGTYRFRCDFHPLVQTGTLVLE